jgi:hypothetical protein
MNPTERHVTGPLKFPKPPNVETTRLQRLAGHTTSEAWIPEDLTVELNQLRVLRRGPRDRPGEVVDPVRVVAVALERCRVAARMLAPGVEDLVDEGWRTSWAMVEPYVKRCTNSNAVSATSRQPLSMVSECPRLGIFVISVAAAFRLCRL